MMRMKRKWRAAAAALAAVAAGTVLGAAPAQATPSSGWNDWSCKPSVEHPEPVVLLHGLGGQAVTNWFYHAPKLAAAGYCVFSTTYGAGTLGDLVGGVKSMRTNAAEVGVFIDKVRATTGAAKVDVVGHSEGTTVGAYYLKFGGGAVKVKHFVGFGANYKGTTLSGLGLLAKAAIPFLPNTAAFVESECASCLEYLPPSDFLTDLNAGGVSVPGPTYTNIVSKYDTVVTPYTSGVMREPGVKDIVLQDVCRLDFSGHLAQAVDPNVNVLIRQALDPANPPRLVCVPTALAF